MIYPQVNNNLLISHDANVIDPFNDIIPTEFPQTSLGVNYAQQNNINPFTQINEGEAELDNLLEKLEDEPEPQNIKTSVMLGSQTNPLQIPNQIITSNIVPEMPSTISTSQIILPQQNIITPNVIAQPIAPITQMIPPRPAPVTQMATPIAQIATPLLVQPTLTKVAQPLVYARPRIVPVPQTVVRQPVVVPQIAKSPSFIIPINNPIQRRASFVLASNPIPRRTSFVLTSNPIPRRASFVLTNSYARPSYGIPKRTTSFVSNRPSVVITTPSYDINPRPSIGKNRPKPITESF